MSIMEMWSGPSLTIPSDRLAEEEKCKVRVIKRSVDRSQFHHAQTDYVCVHNIDFATYTIYFWINKFASLSRENLSPSALLGQMARQAREFWSGPRNYHILLFALF